MFAADFQLSWPSRPQTKGKLLFYFLKLYNFGFYEIFLGSTSSELQQYRTHGSQKSGASQKNREKIIFQVQFWSRWWWWCIFSSTNRYKWVHFHSRWTAATVNTSPNWATVVKIKWLMSWVKIVNKLINKCYVNEWRNWSNLMHLSTWLIGERLKRSVVHFGVSYSLLFLVSMLWFAGFKTRYSIILGLCSASSASFRNRSAHLVSREVNSKVSSLWQYFPSPLFVNTLLVVAIFWMDSMLDNWYWSQVVVGNSLTLQALTAFETFVCLGLPDQPFVCSGPWTSLFKQGLTLQWDNPFQVLRCQLIKSKPNFETRFLCQM